MPVSLLLIIAASAIFRYLAAQSENAFRRFVRTLAGCQGTACWNVLLESRFHDRLPEFRRRGLPLHAKGIALDALCCVTLVSGFWICPPTFLAGTELWALRHLSTFVVIVATVCDLFLLARMAYRTWSPGSVRSDAARSEPPLER